MMFKAKGIGHGFVEGEVLLSQKPISFLGGIDPYKGVVIDESSDIFNKNVAGKILAFPHGKGSTVGSYVIFQLLKSGKAPSAMINENAETIVATGAILSGIPMLTCVPLSILADGDQVAVDAENGTIELKGVIEEPIIMAILMNRDKILLLKHGEKSKTLGGQWVGISERLEEGKQPETLAIESVEQQTGIEIERSDLHAHGDTVYVRSGHVLLKVNPFLIATEEEKIKLDKRYMEYKWVLSSEIKSYKTMVGLNRIIDTLLSRNDPGAKKC